MYIYYFAEVVIIALVVSVIACNILCIYNFVNDNWNDLEGIIYSQGIFIVALLLLYGAFHHVILVGKMEAGLRENFIHDTKCHHLDTSRYHIYDGFGDEDWYKAV